MGGRPHWWLQTGQQRRAQPFLLSTGLGQKGQGFCFVSRYFGGKNSRQRGRLLSAGQWTYFTRGLVS